MTISRMLSLSHRAGRRILPIAALMVMMLAIAPAVRTEEPPVFAITNARIVPVSGPVLAKGTVILRNGIIESVGADVTVPGDARIIDASGLTLYPGLIDAMSNVGLPRPRTQSRPSGPGGMQAAVAARQRQEEGMTADQRQGLTPYVQAFESFDPASEGIESARNAGFTTALVAPTQGFFTGRSSLIDLAGSDVGAMVVKTPVAYHVNLRNSRGFGRGYPSSLMGIIAFVKQTLLDAQHYDVAWNIYNAHRGAERPEYSRALQSLQPLIEGQVPVVLPGDTPEQVRRAVKLAESYKLHLVLAGAARAGEIAPFLHEHNVPVLLTAKFPERPRNADPEAKEELNALRERLDAPKNAAALAKAGVKFAFESEDMSNFKDFLANVRKTVEAGLDKDAALRALTLTPAEIFGVSDRLGSIEKNKTANLVLASGDLFDPKTSLKYVFVDGRMFEIKEEAPARGRNAAERPAAALNGQWTISVNTPEGPLEAVLDLRQNGSAVTGTASSPMGVVDIYEGTFSGGTLKFKVSVSGMIVAFDAMIRGTSISGTAEAAETGVMDFTGARNPRAA